MGKAKYWKGLTAAGIVLAVVLVVIVGISVFPEKNMKKQKKYLAIRLWVMHHVHGMRQ